MILSLLVPGAGPFAAARKARGVGWFVLLTLTPALAWWVLAQSVFASMVPGVLLLASCLVLWILMLWDSFRPMPTPGLATWARWVVLALGLLYGRQFFQQQLAISLTVRTPAMAPTLHGVSTNATGHLVAGDRIMLDRSAYWFDRPRRGDIVVFRATLATLPELPEGLYTFRIAGLPGERVSIQNGRLQINGRPLASPRWFAQPIYTLPPRAPLLSSPLNSYLVPAGHFFVLGDNSAQSLDSRYWGPVPAPCVLGRITRVVWPPAHWKFFP